MVLMPPHATIAQRYIRSHRCNYRRELCFFAAQPTLREAIVAAALSEGLDGKRLTHQRRLYRDVIPSSSKRLIRLYPLLARANDFQHLHRLVSARLKLQHGAGSLYVYDVALRIGSYLNLWPNRVYLHRGSLNGAKKIRIPPRSRIVSKHWLPHEYWRLEPHEIENLLCLYASDLHP
jgi:hypothetical protein